MTYCNRFLFIPENQSNNGALKLITTLTEQGNVMDATILSTKLLDNNTDLPPPLAPVHTPIHKDNGTELKQDNLIASSEERRDVNKVISWASKRKEMLYFGIFILLFKYDG